MITGLLLAALVLLAFAPFTLALSSALSIHGGAPYVSTTPALFPTIIKLAQPKPGKVFVELGSGIGNLLIPAARTGMQVRGVELSPLLSLVAKVRTRRYANVTLETGSAYTTDLRNADVVYCYLFPGMMTKLEPKFARELRPGAVVIAHAFQLPTKQPDRVIPRTAGMGAFYIYSY